MRILLVDRDLQALLGIRWFLQTYLPSETTVIIATTTQEAMTKIHNTSLEAVLLNIDILPEDTRSPFYPLLQQAQCTILAMTAEPIFQHAVKAIDIGAVKLFTKPLDLEAFKRALLSIQRAPDTLPTSPDTFYLQLFTAPSAATDHLLVLIEPEQSAQLPALQNFIEATAIFSHIHCYPLTERLVCLLEADDISHDIAILMREWRKGLLNIGIYDGVPTTIRHMYLQTKDALTQRFYKGYGHIFYTSKRQRPENFDPLVTPEQQDDILLSLEERDISGLRHLFTPLLTHHYHEDDVRIFLTSVLSQLRRFLLKHTFKSSIHHHYRKLFRTIMEEPILYTIIEELLLFGQQLMQLPLTNDAPIHRNAVHEAKAIIHTKYADPSLNLQTVAAEIGISSNYLSTLFSKAEQIPFKRYLQQFRLKKAANYLRAHNDTIEKVAHLHGFEDSNYFIKVFKQHTGMTPHKYRQRID